VLLLTVVAAVVGARLFMLGPAFVGVAALAALAGGVLVGALAAKHSPSASFGAANLVTLGRGALTALLLGLLAAEPAPAIGWLAVALAVLGVALDGVDGRLARRRGEASAFGARFDMETDALLILVLAALVWQLDKAGAWIVLAGLLRYAFIAASFALPWLARPLSPSRRRQTVCVVQIVSLIVALVPLVAAPASAALAAGGLLLLAWSFAADVAWLARRARS
jgi:phosphatidylglycerophosphate synthase